MPNSVARTSLFTIITVIEKNKNIKNKIKYSVARIFAHTSLQNYLYFISRGPVWYRV